MVLEVKNFIKLENCVLKVPKMISKCAWTIFISLIHVLGWFLAIYEQHFMFFGHFWVNFHKLILEKNWILGNTKNFKIGFHEPFSYLGPKISSEIVMSMLKLPEKHTFFVGIPKTWPHETIERYANIVNHTAENIFGLGRLRLAIHLVGINGLLVIILVI